MKTPSFPHEDDELLNAGLLPESWARKTKAHTETFHWSLRKPGPQPGMHFRSLVPPALLHPQGWRAPVRVTFLYTSSRTSTAFQSWFKIMGNAKGKIQKQQEVKSTQFHIRELDCRLPQIVTHFSDTEHTDCQHLCTCTKVVQTKNST